MRLITSAALSVVALAIVSSHADAATLDVGGNFQSGPLYVALTTYNSGNSFLTSSGAITPELLPSNIVLGSPAGKGRSARSLDQVERDHIRAVLAEAGGNRTRAAELLGISAATLWRRMKTM